MRRLLTILILTSSCSRPTENQQTNDTIKIESATESTSGQLDGQENFPDYVKATKLPDSLLIDVDNVIYGDFNADGKKDFASKVTNLENGYQGVLIIHNTDNPEYLVFGAGQEINEMTNLDWIDIFKTLPIGEVIAPTLVDSATGDIIGPDETKQFRLIGNGIFMHINEADGGGILYWTGDQYEWCHIE